MQNFMQIPPRGASRQMGEIYAKNFIYIYVFFLPRTHRSDPLRDFLRLILQTTRFCTRKCLFGVRKLKFNI